jgi:hypothetical protein
MSNIINSLIELRLAYNNSDGSDTPTLINQAKEVKLAWNLKNTITVNESSALFELLEILPDDSKIKAVFCDTQMA